MANAGGRPCPTLVERRRTKSGHVCRSLQRRLIPCPLPGQPFRLDFRGSMVLTPFLECRHIERTQYHSALLVLHALKNLIGLELVPHGIFGSVNALYAENLRALEFSSRRNVAAYSTAFKVAHYVCGTRKRFDEVHVDNDCLRIDVFNH